MHVHIVCRDGDHVIPRLAKSLVQTSGGRWSMGDNPNPKAVLNYFFPYLELEAHRNFEATPIAAYFSHYETDNPHKVSIWNEFSGKVDLRITTARIYSEQLSNNPVAQCRPVIDMQFVPGTRPNRAVVGVSGVISKSSKRKGTDLVYRLARSRGDIEVRASGAGWDGLKCQFFAWPDMHLFYQSLDVFLCTSTIEGVPMTTLEAMACGVPVVIPRGVGLHDEIGEIGGVFCYTAGDYNSMVAALDHALAYRGESEKLTTRATEFNARNWYLDHEKAFENLLCNARYTPPKKRWSKKNSGVYIVAYGDNARDCARNLIASINEHMPGLETALVSSAPLGTENYFIERADTDIGARGAKLSIDTLAPAHWEYVLYLDADTELTAPVPFLFDALSDGWELVICKNPVRFHVIFNMVRPDYHAECKETFETLGSDELLQLNGGVWSYRRTATTKKLMQLWYNEWNRYGARDQAALLRALKDAPVRTYVLGNEWNTVDRYEPFYAHETAGIMHYPMTARRWQGRVNGRLDSKEAWGKVKG